MILYYKLKLAWVQSSMQVRIKSGEVALQRLILTQEEYKASRIEDNELEYQGKMYDVAAVSSTGDGSLEIMAVEDAIEDRLLSIIRILTGADKSNSDLPGEISDFSAAYLPAADHCSFYTCCKLNSYIVRPVIFFPECEGCIDPRPPKLM